MRLWILISFKSQYRKSFVEDAELHLNELESYKFTIKDAVYLLGKAWKLVNKLTIKNCWSKAYLENFFNFLR